jgi:hypothetical protein
MKNIYIIIFITIIIISVMQLDDLLIRSGLTCPEVSSNVCHDSFCQSGSSVSLPWVTYYEAFCLYFVSSFFLYSSNFSKIGVILNTFIAKNTNNNYF